MSVGRLWDAADFRVAAAATAPSGTVFHCRLCDGLFTHGDRLCDDCPLAAGCQLVRCPACGYQFPRESTLGAWWRLWSRRPKH